LSAAGLNNDIRKLQISQPQISLWQNYETSHYGSSFQSHEGQKEEGKKPLGSYEG